MSINDISNINNKALTKIKQDTYNELKDIYTKKYKDININNRKRLYDGLYMEYNALKSIPIMKENIDDIIKNMNLQPNAMPDLDSLSIMSGDSDKNSTKGFTLNL